MTFGRATSEPAGQTLSRVAELAPANDSAPDERFARLAAMARSGERRALESVARLADEFERLARALDARVAQASDRTAADMARAQAELAALEQMLLRRLQAVEAGQAQGLDELRVEMAAAVERLTDRMEASERRAAAAAAELGARVDALSRQQQAGEIRLSEALDSGLAQSRRRTDQLIGKLRAELAARDGALRDYVEARMPSRRPRSQAAVLGLVATAGLAAVVGLTAVGAQLLAARAPSPHAAAVRLPLPLRPTLAPEIPRVLEPRILPEPKAAPAARPSPEPAPSRPDDFAVLSSAIARGDAAALTRTRALAEGGAPVAQLLLAKAYEDGSAGLAQDMTLARQWTERAAAGGERAAMYNLAVYLMTGKGGPTDAAAAARWFEQAARRGVKDAQYNLGLLYEYGRGVPRNLTEAYRWYSVAANSGDGLARARAVTLEPRLTAKERAAANGELEPGASERSDTPVVSPAETVAESQKLLAREGYFIGAADGADSPAYRGAVANYLRDHPQAARPTLAPSVKLSP